MPAGGNGRRGRKVGIASDRLKLPSFMEKTDNDRSSAIKIQRMFDNLIFCVFRDLIGTECTNSASQWPRNPHFNKISIVF